jgi:hypothetical protein
LWGILVTNPVGYCGDVFCLFVDVFVFCFVVVVVVVIVVFLLINPLDQRMDIAFFFFTNLVGYRRDVARLLFWLTRG